MSNDLSESSSIDTDDAVNYVWNHTEWNYIPEPILLKILAQLPVRDILNASECCRRWNDISKDDYLWKKLFQRDFKIDKTIALKPGKSPFLAPKNGLIKTGAVLIDFSSKSCGIKGEQRATATIIFPVGIYRQIYASSDYTHYVKQSSRT